MSESAFVACAETKNVSTGDLLEERFKYPIRRRMSEIQVIINRDRREALQSAMAELVEEFGLSLVMDALRDEAARQTMEEYNGIAVKIHDVLRATRALVDGD